jgi:hypothetical protein
MAVPAGRAVVVRLTKTPRPTKGAGFFVYGGGRFAAPRFRATGARGSTLLASTISPGSQSRFAPPDYLEIQRYVNMAEEHTASRLAAEPGAIERHGSWIVLGRDASEKRVACRCAICGHACQIGAEALEAGGVVCGGCISPRNNPAPHSQGRSFSKQVAEEATKGARRNDIGPRP